MNDDLAQRLQATCESFPGVRIEQVGTGLTGSLLLHSAAGDVAAAFPAEPPSRAVMQRALTLTSEQMSLLEDAGLAGDEAVRDMIEALVSSRSSLLDCSAGRSGTGWTLQMTYPIYADGLSQQTVMAALAELDRFGRVIENWLASLAPIAELRRQTAETINPANAIVPPAAVLAAMPAAEPAAARQGPPAAAPAAMPAAEPAAASEDSTVPKFCGNCGAQLRQGRPFCTQCGAPAT